MYPFAKHGLENKHGLRTRRRAPPRREHSRCRLARSPRGHPRSQTNAWVALPDASSRVMKLGMDPSTIPGKRRVGKRFCEKTYDFHFRNRHSTVPPGCRRGRAGGPWRSTVRLAGNHGHKKWLKIEGGATSDRGVKARSPRSDRCLARDGMQSILIVVRMSLLLRRVVAGPAPWPIRHRARRFLLYWFAPLD